MPPPPKWLRVAFTLAVLGAVVGAVVVGLGADPPEKAPSYALDSPAVWHLEIGLAVFIGLYVPLLVLYLAAQGRTIRITGPAGIGIESAEVDLVETSQAELQAGVSDLRAGVQDLTQLLRAIR
jgi:hypothetical protein